RVGERIEQDVLDRAEDRGRGADAQGQSQDCQKRKARLFAEYPQSVTEVMEDPAHTLQTAEAPFCSAIVGDALDDQKRIMHRTLLLTSLSGAISTPMTRAYL